MSVRGIARYATPKGVATPTNAPVYVDSDDNKLKMIPAGSGSTQVELIDASSVQTLTNKSLTAPIITDAADAAIAVGADATYVFTKGSASAHALGAPTVLGVTLTLCAGSAFAHVITATGLIDNGVTGGSKTTITLASFVGSNIVLQAVQAGKWMVVASNTVTSVA